MEDREQVEEGETALEKGAFSRHIFREESK